MKTIILLVLAFLSAAHSFGGVWGGFSEAVEYTYQNTGGARQPCRFMFRDFNADGHVDFMIDGNIYGQSGMGDYISNSQIFINNGDGSFQNPILFSKGSTHRIVYDAADLNGDGNLDLLIPDFWANAFRIHYGQANVTFGGGTTYGTAVHGGSSQFHDFDKDGDLDVISTSAGSGNPLRIHFYINNGGAFTKHGTIYGFNTFDVPNSFDFNKSLMLKDLNNDGKTDVFISAEDFHTRGLTLIQNGSGFSFDQTVFGLTGVAQIWCDLVDFNDDGYPDLYRSAPNEVMIHLNDGNGAFAYGPSHTITINGLGNRSYLVDVDNDGDLDLTSRSYPNLTGDDVTTYLNDGTNNFTKRFEHVFGTQVFYDYYGYHAVDLHDLNNDGFQDMVAVSKANKVYVFLNAGMQNITAISPNPFNAFAGTDFTYQIETEPAATSYSATNLPAWLSLDPATGILTGTAPATPGNYPVELSATDGSNSVTFTLIINSLPSLSAALDNNLTWYSSHENGYWFNQSVTTHDGVDAAEAPDIPPGQTSLMYAELEGPLVMTFWWEKYSRFSGQSLKFLLDDVEQFSHESISWEQKELNIPEGTHTVAFAFSQPSTDPYGTAWVDEIELLYAPTNYTEWISRYTSITNPDPAADADADGVPNGMEYIAGSDPVVADKGARLNIQINNNEEHLNWHQRKNGSGIRGIDYKWNDAMISLETSTNLPNNTWAAASTGQVTEVTVTDQSNDTESVTLKLLNPWDNKKTAYFRLKVELD